MKKPKLKFEEVFVVENWATEIKSGVGVYFPSNESQTSSPLSNQWLVWFNGGNSVPETFSESNVFTNRLDAVSELVKQSTDYAKYLKENIERNTKKLEELSKKHNQVNN